MELADPSFPPGDSQPPWDLAVGASLGSGMFAAYASKLDADDSPRGADLGERPEPPFPDGWTTK